MLAAVSFIQRYDLDEDSVEDASRGRCQPWQMPEQSSSMLNNCWCLKYVMIHLRTRDIEVHGKTSNPIVVSAR